MAEELGIKLEQVSVAQLDTDVTPFDVSTSASSSMTVMGLATQRAAQDVKKQLLRAAAKVMGEKADSLALKGGRVRGAKGRGVPYGDVIAEYFGSSATEIVGRGLYRDKKSKTAVLGSPHHLLGGGLGRCGAGGGSGHRRHPHPQVCLPGRRGDGPSTHCSARDRMKAA